MNKNNNQIHALLKNIEEKQKKMIEVGTNQGLTSEETIKCSQELDNLLNIYQRLTINEKIFINN